MVRNMDSLGRIVIPIEMKRSLDVEIGNSLEYFIDESDRRILLGNIGQWNVSSVQLVII